MSHFHNHSDSHAEEAHALSDSRLVGAIVVNALLTAAQVVGGVVSGSLSLIADALHNLSDAGSLVVALVARRIGRKPADTLQTFGYRRVELVGALINATTLIIVGLYLAYEALMRFIEPREVAGWTVVIVGGVALVVDVATALLTYSMSKGNLNVKAAFVHNVTDALGSVAVMVAGTLIILYELHVADVIATLLIAGYALYQGAAMTRASTRILALGVPADLDLETLVAALREIEGVQDLHHVHVWDLDESRRSFEAHVLVEERDVALAEDVKGRIRAVLERHAVTHSTLELEFGSVDADCKEGEVVAPH